MWNGLRGTWRYWDWCEFVLEMQHRAGGSLGELLREPQVEVADLLQHKFQLVGGRQYGHPAEEDVITRRARVKGAITFLRGYNKTILSGLNIVYKDGRHKYCKKWRHITLDTVLYTSSYTVQYSLWVSTAQVSLLTWSDRFRLSAQNRYRAPGRSPPPPAASYSRTCQGSGLLPTHTHTYIFRIVYTEE